MKTMGKSLPNNLLNPVQTLKETSAKASLSKSVILSLSKDQFGRL